MKNFSYLKFSSKLKKLSSLGCEGMDNKYYTVGQMAKISNLSNQTLRYYDQIDLFKPVYTDQNTNYRYYAESQLYLLDLIKSLRFVGTPLEKIKEVQHFSIEEMIAFLDEQEQTIAEQLNRLQEAQYTLHKTRKQMEDQLKIPVFDEVFIKEEEEERILCLASNNATPEYVSNDEMLKLTEMIESEGSVQTIRYGGHFPIKDYETLQHIKYEEIFIPILTARYLTVRNDLMNIKMIPAGEYFEVAFKYTPEKYFEMYKKLVEFAKESNNEIGETIWETVMPVSFSPKKAIEVIVVLKAKISK